MYEIVFDEKVIEFMERLDYSIKFEIFDNLSVIKKAPLKFAKELDETYLIQLDKFRILADINKENKLIKVLFIRLESYSKN
jgi:mRNA-degrading endonuclease RelE of RelBE toxin-antitoxin system